MSDDARFPLVSVVVRTLDRRELLREALESVIAQSHRPIEIVLVNDGGETVEDIAALARARVPCTLINHSAPRGRSAAANAGIGASRGDWVGFLDDDDLYLPDHVATVLRTANAPVVELAYAGCRLDRGDGSEGEVFATPFSRDILLLANFIPTCAVLVSRAALLAVGGVDETLPFLEDWDLWLRLAERRDFAFTPEVTSVYRVRPGSVGADMAAERWATMETVFARHWAAIQPRHLVARLRRLEGDLGAFRTEYREVCRDREAVREENRVVWADNRNIREDHRAVREENRVLWEDNRAVHEDNRALREANAALAEAHRLVAEEIGHLRAELARVAALEAEVAHLDEENSIVRELSATGLLPAAWRLVALAHWYRRVFRRAPPAPRGTP